MKTEPTEALRAMANDLKYNTGVVQSNIKLVIEESFISGVKYGQSSPKIKQLEWVEVYKSIFNTDTSFKYAYEIHVNDDGSTILFDSSAGKPKRFINLKDAKSAAQADFEKRIKECLE